MTKPSSLALAFFAAASCIGAMAGGAVAQVGAGASSGASSGGTDSVVAGQGNSDPAQNHGSSQNGDGANTCRNRRTRHRANAKYA